MTKLTNLTAVIALVIGFAAAPVSAQSSGTNTNTGPGSRNTVNNSTQCNTNTTTRNNTNITNNNPQSSNSGNANNSGNTSAGGSQSGAAGNTSTSNTSVNSNTNAKDNCNPQASKPAPAATGGRGAGEKAPATNTAKPAAGATIPVLAETSAPSPASLAAAVVAGFGAIALASRFGAVAFGRLKG